MTRAKSPGRTTTPFNTDQQRWQAVTERDARADLAFVYSVKTTGIYCRPSCGARRARRENVRFYATPAAAERAGYRPCKRCRPNRLPLVEQHSATIAAACRLIERDGEIPKLETLANEVGMSPSHFHRLFRTFTGLTPKDYALAQRSKRVREELAHCDSITAAVHRAGFGSAGGFYATSKSVLGMTPSAFQTGGHGIEIQFAVGECSLGAILVAATRIGICSIAIGDDPNSLIEQLEDQFPHADLVGGNKSFEQLIATVIGFVERPSMGLTLPLDIQGTAFQQRVWQLLCEIPCGKTATYSQIAERLGKPTAVRAVAHACAANRLAVAIPCHRVVRTDGGLAGYRWGVDRKARLLASERTDD